ncbi:MAG: hypothetical protein KF777_15680 [Planctomycetaceae bacterium]|nr:hypothetical protein [Planctomycetaceae bacterium]
MIDSPTASGVEEIRALASSERPDQRWGRHSVRDMLATVSIVEQVLLLLPDDLSVVAVGHDHIQLAAEDFRAVFRGLSAEVTCSMDRNYRTLWIRGIAICTCESIKGWQIPQLDASFETVE